MASDIYPGGWFRRLWHGDEAALLAHYRRLAPGDLRMRFLHLVSDEFLARQARKLREPGYYVIGWFDEGALRGAVEVAVRKGEAEAGFSVETPWRNIGVGRGLMRRALRRARHAGCRGLAVLTAWDNGPMIRLARGAGARVSSREGEVIGEITPERAGWAELTFDPIADRIGLIAALAEIFLVGADAKRWRSGAGSV